MISSREEGANQPTIQPTVRDPGRIVTTKGPGDTLRPVALLFRQWYAVQGSFLVGEVHMGIKRTALASAALVLTAVTSLLPVQVANAQPPSTSVLVPSSGATLSGSTYLDASEPNATSVEFLLFGGTYGYTAPVACTATRTYYGWLCSWNTTNVPDGTYSLVSEASGVGGNAFSSPISITVENRSTTVIVPAASGATLDEAAGYILDAVASPGATSVSFVVDGQFTYNATLTMYGWIYQMPVGTPCDGEPLGSPVVCNPDPTGASLWSVATYPGGESVTSPTLSETFILYPPECCVGEFGAETARQ